MTQQSICSNDHNNNNNNRRRPLNQITFAGNSRIVRTATTINNNHSLSSKGRGSSISNNSKCSNNMECQLRIIARIRPFTKEESENNNQLCVRTAAVLGKKPACDDEDEYQANHQEQNM